MTILQHQDRTIVYQLKPAPFADDVVFLQASRDSMSTWEPVLLELTPEGAAEGRVLLCDWHSPNKNVQQLAQDFLRTVQVLGLRKLHVVACGDAVDMVEAMLKASAQSFGKTLLWPDGGPASVEERAEAIRAFCEA